MLGNVKCKIKSIFEHKNICICGVYSSVNKNFISPGSTEINKYILNVSLTRYPTITLHRAPTLALSVRQWGMKDKGFGLEQKAIAFLLLCT